MLKTGLAAQKSRANPRLGALQTLKTFPAQPVLAGITLAAVAALTGVSLLFLPLNKRLKPTGRSIIDYELAFTTKNANQILLAWGADGQNAARESLYLDFAFLLSYALALSGLTLLLARALAGRLGKVGLLLAPAGLLAGLLDSLENLSLLSMLGGGAVSPIQPLAAGLCAAVKFLLVGAAGLYCLAGGAVWAVLRLQGKSRPR